MHNVTNLDKVSYERERNGGGGLFMLYQGETIEYALFTAIYILLTIQSLVPISLI